MLTDVVGVNGKVLGRQGDEMGCLVPLYDTMVLFDVYLASIVNTCVVVLANPFGKHRNLTG